MVPSGVNVTAFTPWLAGLVRVAMYLPPGMFQGRCCLLVAGGQGGADLPNTQLQKMLALSGSGKVAVSSLVLISHG
jgi:hypothetical protein